MKTYRTTILKAANNYVYAQHSVCMYFSEINSESLNNRHSIRSFHYFTHKVRNLKLWEWYGYT